jgi:hypothetical protein
MLEGGIVGRAGGRRWRLFRGCFVCCEGIELEMRADGEGGVGVGRDLHGLGEGGHAFADVYSAYTKWRALVSVVNTLLVAALRQCSTYDLQRGPLLNCATTQHDLAHFPHDVFESHDTKAEIETEVRPEVTTKILKGIDTRQTSRRRSMERKINRQAQRRNDENKKISDGHLLDKFWSSKEGSMSRVESVGRWGGSI